MSREERLVEPLVYPKRVIKLKCKKLAREILKRGKV
jgi:hypothetical protein